MFDISWGEILFVTGLGLAMIGPKDLPKAANALGTMVGRTVGLLQGARARADQFAAQSDLAQLQNELRSGLRELDAVKAEMAVSMSPGRMVGKDLGRMTGNALVNRTTPIASSTIGSATGIGSPATLSTANSMPPVSPPPLNSSSTTPLPLSPQSTPSNAVPPASLPTATSTLFQTQAAAAEAEWVQQGIAFQSVAEKPQEPDAGSVQLAQMLQQSLLFDRYDQAVAEQDAALKSRMEEIREKVTNDVQEEEQRKTEGAGDEPTTK